MAKNDPAERIATAVESIAKSLAVLTEMGRDVRVNSPEHAQRPIATLATLAEPVARLAQAVSNIAESNARLADERRQMRKIREREFMATMENIYGQNHGPKRDG